ncbi:MAG: UDP-N-acetylmuramoyl-L-alanine--D-glutamate ligase [Candidatus Gracilibacteria bacterium]|nr:UDP-N-acetylmuramoyl-L-alanine--D-glutamate ligase [Candidatus Gracilibacteria bacterium]
MKIIDLVKLIDKKIAILGYGKEGKSTLSFLLKLGFKDITILDKNKIIEQQKGIKYLCGDKYLDSLPKYELIFKSPGISPYNEKIKIVQNKLITQTQLFFDNYEGKIIGITGTKGKSTISTLTYEILKKLGYNVKLVGNIGTPVLDEIDIIKNETYDYIVYELSSYMLESSNLNMYIGLVNNIYNCHLDWHNGRENYEKAKLSIIKNSTYKIVNYELKNNINNIDDIIYYGEGGNYYHKNSLFYKNEQSIMSDEKIALQGEHNKKNISGIFGIVDIIDKKHLIEDKDKIKEVLSIFGGLPHRLENIGVYNGITFIDDGIAVTPEATIAAIETYKQNIGTIILGGQDGDYNFSGLVNILKKYNISNIVLFPDTGEKIFGDLSIYKYEKEFILKGDFNPKILKTKSMRSAVNFAYKNTGIGKICLLSNAAPSYNLWSGFIEKGLEYQNEVKTQCKK